MSGARRFLYGDSKPFPLHMNFLEMLAAATESSSALLWADVRIEKAQRAVVVAATRANDDLGQLDQLQQALDATYAPFFAEGAPQNVCQETAARLAKGSQGAIDQVRLQVTQWRDAAMQKAEESIGRSQLINSLNELLVRHELPDTIWEVSWRAVGDEAVEAQTEAIASIGLRGVMSISVPDNQPWCRPVRAASLIDHVVIHVEREGGWFRGNRLASENLDRYLVTQVFVGQEFGQLFLQKSFKEGAQGFEFRIPRDADEPLLLRRLVGNRPVSQDYEPLSTEDATGIRLLWDAVENPIYQLARFRARLMSATFNKTPIARLKRPGVLSEAIVEILAPLVRELRARSSAEGELNLKLEVENGRREELFIKEEDILSKYEELPPDQRTVFEAFGLGDPPEISIDPQLDEPFVDDFEPVSDPEFDYEAVSNPHIEYKPDSGLAEEFEPEFELEPESQAEFIPELESAIVPLASGEFEVVEDFDAPATSPAMEPVNPDVLNPAAVNTPNVSGSLNNTALNNNSPNNNSPNNNAPNNNSPDNNASNNSALKNTAAPNASLPPTPVESSNTSGPVPPEPPPFPDLPRSATVETDTASTAPEPMAVPETAAMALDHAFEMATSDLPEHMPEPTRPAMTALPHREGRETELTEPDMTVEDPGNREETDQEALHQSSIEVDPSIYEEHEEHKQLTPAATPAQPTESDGDTDREGPLARLLRNT